MAKKILAIAALALAVIFAVPTAAMASGYVPPGNVSSSGGTTASPGQTQTIVFAAGSFSASETVSVTVTGSPAATLGSTSYTATAAGALTITVKIPTSATANSVYSIQAVGVSSGNVGTYRLTVVVADAAAAAPRGLAFTGGTISMLIVWGGAGILALGIALLIVMRVVRRQHAEA
jgi:hypothetical protein